LPTGVRLQDKGVHCPTNCVSCDSADEDLFHFLFECLYAIRAWTMAGLWLEIESAARNTQTAVEAIFQLLQNLSKEQSQRMVMIFWSLWKRRNLKVWEDITETCAEVVERARITLEDWQLANGGRTEGQSVQSVSNQNADFDISNTAATAVITTDAAAAGRNDWQPPMLGRLKCNIDAAFSVPRNRTSIGICIRDEHGVFVLAKTVSFEGVYAVEVGEALGLFHALQWTSDMQMDNIDFEVDSKVTKDAFTSG